MALEIGVNSYVDLASAELYFADRMDAAAWASGNQLIREQALIMATATLEDMPWIGKVRESTQLLCWPRLGISWDVARGEEIVFDTTTPSRVLRACYELAYHYLNNDGLFDDTGGVVTLQIDTINLQRIRAPSKMPTIVKKLLAPYLSGTGNKWWRAN